MPLLTSIKRKKSIISHFDIVNQTFSSNIITHYPFFTKKSQLIWPKADKFLQIIENINTKNVFYNIVDNNKYVFTI